MRSNILSLDQLLERGFTVFMKKRTLYLRDQDNRLLAQVEMIKNHMFKLNLMNAQVRYLKACIEDKT
jgi:gluconate kinase